MPIEFDEGWRNIAVLAIAPVQMDVEISPTVTSGLFATIVAKHRRSSSDKGGIELMRLLRYFVVVTGLCALSCDHQAQGPSAQGMKKGSTAENTPNLPRRLSERIVGSWTTTDPGLLRGVHFTKENAATFAILQKGHGSKTLTGTYQLTGTAIKFNGQVKTTTCGNDFWILEGQVIDGGEDYLVLQGFDGSEQKPQRFTRE